GDQVAVVIAETLNQAKDAAASIDVDYGVLPAVADPAKARDPKAPQIHDNAPTDAAFKNAKHVTRLNFINNRLVPNAIEPRASIGDYDAGTDSSTLWV